MPMLFLKKAALAAALIAGGAAIAPAQADPTNILQQIKTVFVIALENHDWTQACPDCRPQQVFGNPAAPYVNSLITPGNPNAAQVSYATKYYNAGYQVCIRPSRIISGRKPGRPSGFIPTMIRARSRATCLHCQHLTGQMTAAGIAWKSYQEDLEYTAPRLKASAGTRRRGAIPTTAPRNMIMP